MKYNIGIIRKKMTGHETTLQILNWLLSRQAHISTVELRSLTDWQKLYDCEITGWDAPVDRAVIGGFLADRIAYAFTAGYESALRRLVPSLPPHMIVSFCVTEETGAHPASIASTLRKNDGGEESLWTLNGSKKFITLALESELLLVAASTGTTSDGKNMLRMVLVGRTTPGIEIAPMTPLPFVPEISHGTAVFRNVMVNDADILPGDGYRDYIRPFRTIEDLHVFAAVGGYVFRIACLNQWPRPVKEQIVSLIVCVRTLALHDPSAPATHIALGGLQAQIAALLESTSRYWETIDEKTRAAWERDRGLLRVAENARNRRREAAWSTYR